MLNPQKKRWSTNSYWFSIENFIMIMLIITYFFCNITALFFIFILFRTSKNNTITIVLSILFFVIISFFRIIFDYCYQQGLIVLQNDLRRNINWRFKKKYLTKKQTPNQIKGNNWNLDVSNLEFFVRNFFMLKYDFLLISISVVFLLLLWLVFHFYTLILLISLGLFINGIVHHLLLIKIKKNTLILQQTRSSFDRSFTKHNKFGTDNKVTKVFFKEHHNVLNVQNKLLLAAKKLQITDQLTSMFLFFAVIIYFYYFVTIKNDFFYSLLITAIFYQNFIMMLFKKTKENLSNYPRYYAISKNFI